jgi:outer membrane protein TolC
MHRLLPAGLLAALVLSGGCQRYERAPLDLGVHRDEFLARSIDSQPLTEFAAQMREDPASAQAGFDLANGVSLAEGQAIAMVFNAKLRTERLRAGVTAASAEHAGLWEDPVLGVDLTRIIESVTHPWKLGATIGLTIPISGRLEHEKQLAGDEHAVELAKVAQAEWELRAELQRAWARWSALQTQQQVTGEFLQQAEQVLGVVDTMERAGELSRTEARLFKIEQTARRADLQRVEAMIRQSELEIRALLGLSPAAEVSLVAIPLGASGETAIAIRDGSGVDTSIGAGIGDGASHPLLVVAQAEYQASERTLELEISKQVPDLSISPGYGREEGQDQILFGFGLPIPILNGNRRAIEEARAAREAARGNAYEVQESLLSAIAIARAELEAANRHRVLIESELIPLVDAQDGDARKLAQLGEVNTLVLLESLVRRQEAKVQLIEAMRDEELAAMRLSELLGPTPAALTHSENAPTSEQTVEGEEKP